MDLTKNKIVIEGKGRVLLTNNPWESNCVQNRRVDMLIRKNSFGKGIYNSFQDNHEVGRPHFSRKHTIQFRKQYLNGILSKKLDRIVKLLEKNKI
jgi:hypothetical protein